MSPRAFAFGQEPVHVLPMQPVAEDAPRTTSPLDALAPVPSPCASTPREQHRTTLPLSAGAIPTGAVLPFHAAQRVGIEVPSKRRCAVLWLLLGTAALFLYVAALWFILSPIARHRRALPSVPPPPVATTAPGETAPLPNAAPSSSASAAPVGNTRPSTPRAPAKAPARSPRRAPATPTDITDPWARD